MRLRTHSILLAALTLLVAVGLARMPGGDGVRALRTAAFGRGSTVVLVHGLGSRPEHWLPTARLLARRHRVVLVELLGHGDGERGDLSLDRATEALDAALRDADRGSVTLVGHSVGGLVATSEALAHPDRVRHLVLVETALRPQFEGDEREAMLDALQSNYRALLRTAYLSFGRDSAQGEALLADAAALDSARIAPWIRLALTADLSARVAELRPPVLAVLAERSWPNGEAWSVTRDALGYTSVPRLEPVRFDGCGHFVMLDRPGALAAAIERFIGRPEQEPLARR